MLRLSLLIHINISLSHTFSLCLSLLQAVTLAELQTRSSLEKVSEKYEKSIESVARVVQYHMI